MSYVCQIRKGLHFRINEAERAQIDYIMQREGIPDISKTIRYCIEEKAKQLQTMETPQKAKGGEA